MKRNFTIAILPLLLLSSVSFGKKVDVKDAMLAGRNFYYERIRQHSNIEYRSLFFREVIPVVEQEEVLFYAFSIGDKGYVVVSADDAVPPVLAYSFDSDYPLTGQPPQFTAWMDQYKRQILFAKRTGAEPVEKTRNEWSRLLAADPDHISPFRGRGVTPFITSRWNQGFPYNEKCPSDPGGSGVHAVVGCVPVAMGQIMYYYCWPLTGKGSYTYTDTTYGVQSVDFGATEYKWNNMKDVASTNNDGIAELLYHLGVSCDLVYGPSGSGMYNHKAAYALRTFFKFSPETRYVFRDSTSLDWDSLIIEHLDRKMPLYYAGWSVPNINGHAFVCDGYQGGDFFHFNFGWGGTADGYFYLDNLTPSGNNFNLAQELIINIYPDTLHYTYPVYCNSESNILTFRDGTIEDGSGPIADYKKPSFCGWLLNPQGTKDSITSITISINKLDISGSDTLILFDGGSSFAPVLAKYTGNSIPASVTSSGNQIYIYFKTNGTASAPGWSLTYNTSSPIWCLGTALINSDTAEISDGSQEFDYANNASCRWKLFPQNGDSLTVYFRYFDTEPGMDVLKIYDFDDQTLLANLSGHYDDANPPPPVTAPSGKMYLIFSTNGSVTGKGWDITYPRSPVGIESKELPGLTISPNPARDQFNIRFVNKDCREMDCELFNSEGKKVFSQSGKITPGNVERTFGTPDLPSGLYLLKITTDHSVTLKKLIIDTAN